MNEAIANPNLWDPAEADPFLCYPEPPRESDGKPMGPNPRKYAEFYSVTNGTHLSAAYNSAYYRSVDEVLADLIGRIKSGEVEGKWSNDFVVWRSGRLLVAVHNSMSITRTKVVRFVEDCNDPGGNQPLPGWPTYEEWVSSGRGPLWYRRSDFSDLV